MQREDLEMRVKRLHEELRTQSVLMQRVALQLEQFEKDNCALQSKLRFHPLIWRRYGLIYRH